MSAATHNLAQAARNCSAFGRLQFQERDSAVRSYAKLTPAIVVHLLATAASNARAKAKQLLVWMTVAKWEIRGTLHRGGRGNANRPPDMELHFDLLVKGGKGKGMHHVRCSTTRSGAVYVFDVTL